VAWEGGCGGTPHDPQKNLYLKTLKIKGKKKKFGVGYIGLMVLRFRSACMSYFVVLIYGSVYSQVSFAFGPDYYILPENRALRVLDVPVKMTSVVRVGGCSGAFVSRFGLILTNYHCVRGLIPDSVIDRGYVAMGPAGEIPLRNLRVDMVYGYWDITPVGKKPPDSIRQFMKDRWGIELEVADTQKRIFKFEYGLGEVVSYQSGTYYFLCLYDTFNDVRLVMVPSRFVGGFGGEADNWEWPRHTADFAFVRAYRGEYPVMSRSYLRMAEYFPQENDTVFVIGFPGETMMYISKDDIDKYVRYFNVMAVRVMKPIMESFNLWMMVRGKPLPPLYYKRYSSISNVFKRYEEIVRQNGMEEVGTGTPEREYAKRWLRFAAPPLVQLFFTLMKDSGGTQSHIQRIHEYANNMDTTLERMLMEGYVRACSECGISFPRNGFFKIMELIARGKYKNIAKVLREKEMQAFFINVFFEDDSSLKVLMDTLRAIKGRVRERYREGHGYPDANGTRRVSVGVITGMPAQDGLFYMPMTTLDGMMSRCSKSNPEFICDSALVAVYRARGGNVPLNFITSAHTTGGNSGSPVIDKNGFLVGVNFDRCRQSITCDFGYSPLKCRNIVTSSHFIFFLLGEVYVAPNLLNELRW